MRATRAAFAADADGGPVQVAGQHRPEPPARGDVERPVREQRPPGLAALGPHQRQPQQQLRQRQLALDAIGHHLLRAVQDQIARHVGEHRDVVAERRPRIAVLDELLARSP